MKRKSTTLRQRSESAKIKALEAQVKDQEKQIAHLDKQLVSSRAARKPRSVKPAAKRSRKRGDIVRVLFGDLHGCMQDDTAVSRLLSDIKALAPDEIIMGGDMVDCAGFLAEHHTLGHVQEMDYSYEEDCAQAAVFFDRLADAAPRARIEWIEGNHEWRVEKWAVTVGRRSKQDAAALLASVHPYKMTHGKERGIIYYKHTDCYDGLTQPGWIKRGKIFVTHGISTVKHAAAATLAKVGGNVVYFHSHRMDSFHTDLVDAGPVAAWCPGCLCGRYPMWRHTDPTTWTQGYAVQFISATEHFLHVQVPLVQGESLLTPLLSRK